MGDPSNTHQGEVWTEVRLAEGNYQGYYWRLNPQRAASPERKKYLRIERTHTSGEPPDIYYVPSVLADKYKKYREKNPDAKTAPGLQDSGMDNFHVFKADGTAIYLQMKTLDLCKLMQTSLDKGEELKPLDRIQKLSNPLPTNSLYVRMKYKSIKWLDTSGGGVDPDRDEADIYIPEPVIKEWSSGSQTSSKGRRSQTGSGSKVPTTGPEAQARSGETPYIPSPSIWVRNGNGKAIEIHVNAHPSSQQSGWETLYTRAIKFSQAQGSAGRCLNPNIDLFLMPVSPEDKDLLKKAVGKAREKLGMGPSKAGNMQGNNVEENEKDTGDEKCKQKVTIWEEHPTDGKIAAYKKLARSPLGHYETWIRKKDYEAYSKSRPDRLLPSIDEMEKVSVADRPEAGKDVVGPGDGKVKKKTSQKGLSKKANSDRVELRKRPSENGVEEKVDAAVDQIRPNIGHFASAGEGKKLSEQLGDVDRRKRDIIATRVTSSKIRNACGTRDGQSNQDTVMGASATAIAKIFKWDAGQAEGSEGTNSSSSSQDSQNSIVWGSSRYAPAEWLHRSAYSWGGLLGPDSTGKNASGTSQIFRNLVFGTSECNSVMIRYEEAFKALIERQAPAQGPNHGGILVTDIRRDVCRARFADDAEQPQPEHFRASTRSWLCAAMDYVLYAGPGDGSRVGTFRGPYKETFYPFQRGFFTKFEKVLDQAILDELYPPSVALPVRPAPGPRPSSRGRGGRKRPSCADLSGGPTPAKQIPPI